MPKEQHRQMLRIKVKLMQDGVPSKEAESRAWAIVKSLAGKKKGGSKS